MFIALVWFDGPASKWGGAPHENEVIYRRAFKYRWMAEIMAQAKIKDLINCKWSVIHEPI